MANNESESESITATLKELTTFMRPTQRLDLKVLALTRVLSLTGSEENKKAIFTLDEFLALLLTGIFDLTQNDNKTVAKVAILSLINLSAENKEAVKMFQIAKSLSPPFPLLTVAIEEIINAYSTLADSWSLVLSNLTRCEDLVEEIINELEKDNKTVPCLLKVFTKLSFHNQIQKVTLDYIASIFCNLTQSARGRELALKYDLLEKIMPFVSYDCSIGTIGILKNFCFDPIYHSVMLIENDDILHTILRPLCGPPEEFTDEERKKLPFRLQCLSEMKKRGKDPGLRKMVLEILLQLCATKQFREILRSNGVYEILREYHKWESNFGKDKECVLACENVVDILIKKEEEIGLDNYKEVDIPEDVAVKFAKEDSEQLQNIL